MEEIRDGLPTDKVEEVTNKLRIHLDKPASYQLPAESGALIGGLHQRGRSKMDRGLPGEAQPESCFWRPVAGSRKGETIGTGLDRMICCR